MPQRNFLSIACITLFVVVGAWTASIAPAHAGDWRSMNKTDFPAYVRAIVLSDGNRIASSSSTCWGKWCVTFGPKPPAAKLIGDAGAVTEVIYIFPLECKNPVAGVTECSLTLQPSRNVAVIQLSLKGVPGMAFNIRFPQDLILE